MSEISAAVLTANKGERIWRKGCQPKNTGKATVFSIFGFDPTNSSTTGLATAITILKDYVREPQLNGVGLFIVAIYQYAEAAKGKG